VVRSAPVIPLDEGAVAWSCPEGARAGRPLAVLLHGFGGHESDWAAWFHALPEGVVGAALRGPVKVDQRWGWVDFAARGSTAAASIAGLSVCARGVLAWLDRQEARPVALVGWSQGGALAVHLLRQRSQRFAAAALVAGFVWDRRPHAGVRTRRPPVWYGMGAHDDVITPAVDTASRDWLAEHTDAHFVDFPDETHMLSHAFVDGALRFIAEALNRG
jgi:phospholipase/carboxylesterase